MADRSRPRRGVERIRDVQSRSRSPSPGRPLSHPHRTRSPRRHHHKHKNSANGAAPSKVLPYNSRTLSKYDYNTFKPMFALYLDIQKNKILEDLGEIEVKGRWKSFIGKWNRGELSEGWYDPATLQKAQQSESTTTDETPQNQFLGKQSPIKTESPSASTGEARGEDNDSDDSVGPRLPGQEGRSRSGKTGPYIPNTQDLELKREMDTEDGLARRDEFRYERKLERKAQKEALDELVPRADAGTRERQLEKKKEVNEKMKSFRERSPGAAEVPDAELMGGEEGTGEFKKIKQELERKKTERELRKEEMLRARMAEREERLSEYRAKEDTTMEMLKALAKQRFG